MPYYDPSFGDEYNPMPMDYPGFWDAPIRRHMTPDGAVIDPAMDNDLPPAIDRPKPSRFGRIAAAAKKYAPDLIGGALAAGSQPNIAGGGPTDVIRAAAAGYAVPQARAARAEIQARQRQADERAARKEQIDIEQSEAQRKVYEAHAKLYEEQANKPGFKERYEEAIAGGATPQQALIYGTGGTLQDKSIKPKEDAYTQITKAMAERLEILPDKDGRYWIPNSSLEILKPQKQDTTKKPTFTETESEKIKFRREIAPQIGYKEGTPEYNQFVFGSTGKVQPPQKPVTKHPAVVKPTIKDFTDEAGNVTRVIQYPGKPPVTQNLGKLAAPKTPSKGNPKNELLDAIRKQFPANF